jgi:uncharacterized protein (DUF924 family)
MSPEAVAQFWMDAGPDRWFAKDHDFDAKCRAFEAAHHAAARGEFSHWEATPEGALALLVLLDQIPRNIYRGSAHAFATDGLAQAIAQRAVAVGHDAATPMPQRMFFYLPLEHAENLDLQRVSVELFEATGNENYARYARIHYDIIARFGRFPHRNASLGRVTTPEEQAFLDGGGFSG